MINNFIEKINDGYYTKGSLWEFDWYIDCFFVEAMSFNKNPVKIGYMQPILGDMFLDFKYVDLIRAEFKGFLSDDKKTSELIKKQSKILKRAQAIIKQLKNGMFYPEEYKNVQLDLSLLMASVSVVFDPIMPKVISEIATDQNVNELDITNYVIGKSSRTKLNESNRNLIKIYSDNITEFKKVGFVFANLSGKVQKETEKHVLLYSWLNTGGRGSNGWTAEDFVSQLSSLVETSWHSEDDPKINIINKTSLRIIDSLVRINTNDNVASDLQIELDWFFQKYLKSKLGKSYIESIIENLTYEEIISILNNPSLISNYKDRRNNQFRVAWPQDGKVLTYYFKNKKEFDNVQSLVKENDAGGELKGNIACRGVAEGKARLILKLDDLNDFVKGEVLVASMTQPSYVTAMSKAAAIITDVGGITSHAAILSREFGIPCIVGTRNATKFFKNGDLVFVDANNGTIVKRN